MRDTSASPWTPKIIRDCAGISSKSGRVASGFKSSDERIGRNPNCRTSGVQPPFRADKILKFVEEQYVGYRTERQQRAVAGSLSTSAPIASAS